MAICVKLFGLHHKSDNAEWNSEDLTRICRKFNIRTVFRTPSTLKHELCKIKDRDSAMVTSGVVYEIPYGCRHRYIGEMKRALHGYQIERTSGSQERRD